MYKFFQWEYILNDELQRGTSLIFNFLISFIVLNVFVSWRTLNLLKENWKELCGVSRINA